MFRKRKDSEGTQGLNRISRLIDERQRENASTPDDEAVLDADDTIVLNRPAAQADSDDAGSDVSLVGAHTQQASHLPEPSGRFEDRDSTDQQRQQPRADAAYEAPATAFAQSVYEPAPWEAQQPAPSFGGLPSTSYEMPVPDLGQAAFHGTLVAADAEWEGKLHAQGDVRIEGVLRGEIETEGTLTIAPHAAVHGIVRARDIMLGGDVEGEVSCDQRLEILPGGSARGQINSGTLVVHEGAYIDSRFQMRRDDGES